VQPQFDAVLVEQLPDGGTTPGIECGQGVLPRVELDVDVAQMVLRRPLDRVFKFEAAADVDADAVAELHWLPLVNDAVT